MNSNKHTSVFLQEAVEALNVKNSGTYVDATFGEGGHSREIQRLGGKVLGIDADAHQVSKQKEHDITVVHGNFSNIKQIAHENGFDHVDGVIFDFGLSMEQLDKSRRGFSYRRYDEPLDMRIGDSDVTAQEIIEGTEEDILIELMVKYSEDIYADEIVKEIIRTRRNGPIATVGDLISIINKVLEKKNILGEQVRAHVYARIFQALRIIVNDEFDAIKQGLEGALALLKPEGRIVIITFHSLEDRIVKLFGREHRDTVIDEKINVEKKRSLQKFERSAQLRILIKKI